MCGPTGVGVLWGKHELLEKLEPGVYGGGIVEKVMLEGASWRESLARFEAGTPNIAGAIRLGAAVAYLENVGVKNIYTHTQVVVKEALAHLREIPGVRILAEGDSERNIGIVSFVMEGIHAHDLAEILGREGVAIRSGHHCAEPFVTALGVSATARASFYLYNTADDIGALIAGIKKAKEVFKV
ncbi:MAG: Cysteine desulfurase [Parcubacteria group bacterium GW2011_GWA1_47_8]|nr:MAG: Cysteine desulfurase [Parcubacteria group bacterium GW2011_GWA1_47_8]